MRLSPTLVLLPLLIACVPDVGTGKIEARVEAVDEAPRPAPTATHVLSVDPARSRVHALGAKVTATHDILFRIARGELSLDADGPVALDITIDMPSLQADQPRLTNHLKNEDFFDVGTFPTSRFTSTRIVEKTGPEGTTHELTGTFTIRGQSKRITFPARIAADGSGGTARAVFVIDRRDFGVVYPGRKDDLIQDNVVMTIDLVTSGARQL